MVSLKASLLLLAVLSSLSALAQKAPFSATLTNPGSQTYKFDPKQKLPKLAFNCFTSDGKPRSYFCEFAIVEMEVIGKNGVSLATVTPDDKPTTISVKKSQSSNVVEGPGGSGSLGYRLVLRYRRIAKPTFPTAQYTISTAHVDHPSTPSELTSIHPFTEPVGKLPGPVQEYSFIVSLNYSGGSAPSLVGGDVRYIQIANPTMFDKIKAPTSNLSDRAEAFLRFFFSVDFKN